MITITIILVFFIGFLLVREFFPEDVAWTGKIFEKKPEFDLRYKDNMIADKKQVEKIINSCNTYTQLGKCRKLIRFLKQKYNKKVDDFFMDYTMSELDIVWNTKANNMDRKHVSKN